MKKTQQYYGERDLREAFANCCEGRLVKKKIKGLANNGVGGQFKYTKGIPTKLGHQEGSSTTNSKTEPSLIYQLTSEKKGVPMKKYDIRSRRCPEQRRGQVDCMVRRKN